MPIKIYEYKTCSTCQRAIQHLDRSGIEYTRIPIVDQPPSKIELQQMLEYLKKNGGTFKQLFNTSGVQYRELKISDQIKAGLTETEAITLLSRNGKLIKRPFLLTERGGSVGFKPDEWKKIL